VEIERRWTDDPQWRPIEILACLRSGALESVVREGRSGAGCVLEDWAIAIAQARLGHAEAARQRLPDLDRTNPNVVHLAREVECWLTEHGLSWQASERSIAAACRDAGPLALATWLAELAKLGLDATAPAGRAELAWSIARGDGHSAETYRAAALLVGDGTAAYAPLELKEALAACLLRLRDPRASVSMQQLASGIDPADLPGRLQALLAWSHWHAGETPLAAVHRARLALAACKQLGERDRETDLLLAMLDQVMRAR
jgi:hypothetical protein